MFSSNAGGTHATGMLSCYRLQRSWGKVIFSVAYVKNSVPGTPPPGQVPPPLRAGTPLGRYSPPGRYTPQGRYTPMVNEQVVRILLECILVYANLWTTRMHSSRMHTACSSGHPGGSPPGTPLEQIPPRTRHPLFPAYQAPLLGPGTPPPEQTPLPPRDPGPAPPPVNRITDACKNITLPQLRAVKIQTSGCKNITASFHVWD